jgi:hypothetical protein
MAQLPRSRTAHVRTSRGEHGALIAYDVRNDAGHVLNATSAAVYELADGTRSVRDIARKLAERTGVPVDDDVIQLALQDLAEAKLLETPPAVTRRDLMRRLALSATAAALLPSLGSIDNLSHAIAPAPRLVGSSSQAGPGYYLQPYNGFVPYRPYRPRLATVSL